MLSRKLINLVLSLGALSLLSACEEGMPKIPDTQPDLDGSFEVAVNIEGLEGEGLSLRLNEGDPKIVSENGSFAFDEYLKTGETYQVVIDSNPVQPNQECYVEEGQGKVASNNIDNISIKCATLDYKVGGVLTGLVGGELVLKASNEQLVTLTTNGEFHFPEPVVDGTSFKTVIQELPGNPTQVCSLTNANGTVTGGDYLDLIVACSVKGYLLGGEVDGLLGSGLVLVNNKSEAVELTGPGQFSFDNKVADGTEYSVTVGTQPESPNQVCQVENPKGMIGGADVNNLSVSCVTRQYALQGRIVGLKGEGLEISVNGDKLEEALGNGLVEFLAGVDDYSDYTVSVSKQPANPSQSCEVTKGSGKIDGADVDDILIVCDTNSFEVGGSVSGLQGSGLSLQLNGKHDLAVEADGGFEFLTSLEDDSEYSVTIQSQPTSPEQQCRVTNGMGSVSGVDVSNILISCNNTYALGGSIEGLAESVNVVFQLNGQDDLTIENNGNFVFQAGLKTGEEYAVTIKSQPQGPNQICTLVDSVGTVGSEDILNVSVSCETLTYKVGVQVSGLMRNGLVLQNNGGDNLLIDTDGEYEFNQPVPDHESFDVVVFKTPEDILHRCDVIGGAGHINGANVTGIEVGCERGVAVKGTVSGLIEGNTVSLVNSETEALDVTSNGEFVFEGLLVQGEEYAVEVKAQPEVTPQVCSVENGSGVVSSYYISGVKVECLLPMPVLSLEPGPVKKLLIKWNEVAGTEEYRLFENKDGQSGFSEIASFDGDVSSYQLDLAILKRLDAQYIVEACAAGQCISSQTVQIDESIIEAVGYYKASNTNKSDNFGYSIAISGDGSTMVVGAKMEQSSAQGLEGDQSDNSLSGAGAVYVFTKISDEWVQQAYIKPSNTHESQYFGESVALSESGDLLVVGAPGDASAGSDQEDRSSPNTGAVFAFSQNMGSWHQEAYIKASNARGDAHFGNAVSLSKDGSVLAVGSKGESSGDRDDPANTLAPGAGAVYKFERGVGGLWEHSDYIKGDLSKNEAFGYSLDCNSECSNLVIGAPGGNSVYAVEPTRRYSYKKGGASGENFGFSVSLASENTNHLLVGHPSSGLVYSLFRDYYSYDIEQWLSPINATENSLFGTSLALAGHGTYLIIGAPGESLDASGINDIPIDNDLTKSGAVYVYKRVSIYDDFEESEAIYIKPSQNDSSNHYGASVAISSNGGVLGIGAPGEAGSSVGIGGDEEDNSLPFSGAVFMY